MCCCCYCCSSGTDHHSTSTSGNGGGGQTTGGGAAAEEKQRRAALGTEPAGGQKNGQKKAASEETSVAALVSEKSSSRGTTVGDTATEEVSAGGSTKRQQQQEKETAANRVQQNEQQTRHESESRVAGGRQSSSPEKAESVCPLDVKCASESSKWLLGCKRGPESSGKSSQTSKYNRSNSESSAAVRATLSSLPAAAASHRKSFEMKSIWNYIRNQSSSGTVGCSSSSSCSLSPQKQSLHEQSQQSDILSGKSSSSVNATNTNANFASNFTRFSSILRGGGGSNVQPYSSSTRGNSIPENVLLGLLPPIADLSQGGCGNKGHNGRQRNSAPTIIQKDKTEKAWERMLKLKSNEKKEKRKTARLMLKSWVTPSNAGRSGRHSKMAATSNCTMEEPITTVVEHSVSHHGGRRLSQIDKYIRANVVVIIDKVSPTTNGHLDDHLSMLTDDGGDHGCSGRSGDFYDQSITSEDNFTSCKSCTAQVSALALFVLIFLVQSVWKHLHLQPE